MYDGKETKRIRGEGTKTAASKPLNTLNLTRVREGFRIRGRLRSALWIGLTVVMNLSGGREPLLVFLYYPAS